MNTWATGVTQAEPHLRAWATEFDQIEAELKAAANQVKTGAVAHIIQHDAARQALNQRIADQIQQWDAELDQLDDELVAAAGQTGPELLAAANEVAAAAEGRLAVLRTNSEAGRQQLQASLGARLRELEAGIDALESQVATAEAQARAKMSARLGLLRPKHELAQQELSRLVEANRAVWRAALADVNRALDDLAAAIEHPSAPYGA